MMSLENGWGREVRILDVEVQRNKGTKKQRSKEAKT